VAWCLLLAILLTLSATTTVAKAGNIDGVDLLNFCKAGIAHLKDNKAETRGAIICLTYVKGYVRGYYDSLGATINYIKKDKKAMKALGPKLACIPKGAHTEQMVTTINEYLSSHPTELNDSAANLIHKALVSTYPCSQG